MDPRGQTQGAPAKEPSFGPYTWDDFVALPDEDKRELIDGQLIEVDVPTLLHEHIQTLLSYFLTGWALATNAGYVLGAGYKIRVSSTRGVMPDVQFYRADNPTRPAQQGLTEGRPDLAVEIISPSSERYDRVTKLSWYAKLGVPEYWIVSPELKTLERLILREGRYVVMEAATDDNIFKPETFPGLEVPLAKLWTVPGLAPAAH